jgi:hypothetical protein
LATPQEAAGAVLEGWRMKSLLRTLVASAVVAAAMATPVIAQDWRQAPTYGTVTLSSGFTPDPHNLSVESGGPINAAQTLGGECVGFIANAPDVDLQWTAGSTSLPLVISVDSRADTTLAINAPDGKWYCTDDGGINALNPGIRFDNPMSGLYDIYVGTYGSSSNNAATLSISELSSH